MTSIARTLLIVALLIPGWAGAIVTPPSSIAGEVIDHGLVVVPGAVVNKAAPDTAAGRTGTYDKARFVHNTNVIPAKQGTAFGFRYRLSGLQRGTESFEMRAIHPAMKGPDGRERTVSAASFVVESVDGLYEDDLIYKLSEPFEVLQGKWVLQILYQGRQLISREFLLQ